MKTATIEANDFKSGEIDHRNHLSPALLWRWHFQDFRIHKVTRKSRPSIIALFKPRYAAAQFIVKKLYARDKFPLTALSSIRLAFITAIIGGGVLLDKKKKDGEVIAKSVQLNCRQPILYDERSVIPVEVEIEFLRQTDRYHLFVANFKIGVNAEHQGNATLFYCRPGLKQFSYL